MRPPNGRYSLTTNATFTTPSTTVVYDVTDAGIPTTFGLLSWQEIPPPGAFVNGDIAIRFLDGSTFVAVNGAAGYSGTYSPAL